MEKPVLSQRKNRSGARELETAQRSFAVVRAIRSTLNTQIDRFRPRARIGCAGRDKKSIKRAQRKKSQRATPQDAKKHSAPTTQG